MSTPLSRDFLNHAASEVLGIQRKLNLEGHVGLDSLHERRRIQRDRSNGGGVQPQDKVQLLVPHREHGIRVFQNALEMEKDGFVFLHGGVHWHGGGSERRYFEGGKAGCEGDAQEHDGHAKEAGDDGGGGEVEEVDVDITVVFRHGGHGEFVRVAMKMRMRSLARKRVFLKVLEREVTDKTMGSEKVIPFKEKRGGV